MYEMQPAGAKPTTADSRSGVEQASPQKLDGKRSPSKNTMDEGR